MNILRVYTCRYCNKYFVMIRAKDSIIPVNVNKNDKLPADTVFNVYKMRSHLKDCERRRNDWQKMKNYYLKSPGLIITKKKPKEILIEKPVKVQKKLTEAERAEHDKRFEQIVAEEKRLKGISNGT